MGYIPLPVLYYKNPEQYQAVYESRISSDSAVRLPIPLRIHGAQAFYCYTPQIARQIEYIYRLSNAISVLWEGIPAKSKSRYYAKTLIDEIMGSNAVEGIHSSRQELRAAFDAVTEKKKQTIKFNGIVAGYLAMYAQNDLNVELPEDIRRLYDVVLLPDLETSLAPDGKIFRREGVSVVTATGKEIHRGIMPEDALIAFITAAIQYVNSVEYSLVGISAFHYLFGHAHPFYDGNGRMARYLSSGFLGKNLHLLVGLNMSQVISSNRKAYYEAFELCNDSRAKGDITPFILYYLSTIEQSANGIQEELEQAKAQLEYHRIRLSAWLGEKADELSLCVLEAMLEVTLFSDVGISVGGIARYAEVSAPTVRDRIQKLVALGCPIASNKEGKKTLYRLKLETEG